MLATENTITFRTGTYRTASPEQTWRRVRPMLSRFLISRVADITMLDEIGLPVHVAYRPVGRTFAVSIGIGLTMVQSRVSAVMESIEAWHAENPRLEIVCRSSAGDLGLPYDVRSLNLAVRSPLTDATVLDWVSGAGLLTGTRFLVPFETIYLDFTRGTTWADLLFRPSSNGLASGNAAIEATLHALLEIIERDCIDDFTRTRRTERRYVDPASATHPDTVAIHRALRTAGCHIEVCDITNAIGVPCFSARIWAPDVPQVFGGFGCHVDPHIAVGRAMTEAAQSRLALVSGARDDIAEHAYRTVADRSRLRAADPPPDPLPPYRRPFDGDDIAAVVRYCADRVARVTGIEPFVVDLTHDDIGIAVSKVFAPGLELHDEPALQRAQGPGDEDE
jgi:YcaO-like protein with predicted kinase domain